MAHNTLTITTVSPTAASWAASAGTIAPAQWQDLSRKIAQAANGVFGSAHAPTSPIVLAGSGLDVTGPTQVLGEGTLSVSGGALFSHQDGDWPELGASHPARTKPILTSGLNGLGAPWWIARPRLDLAGVQSQVLGVNNYDGTYIPARLQLPLKVLDGAPFSSVTMTFRVGQPHTALPATMPRIAVLRIDANGVATPITTLALGTNPSGAVATTQADAFGYVTLLPPASPAVWYAGGAAQSVTIPIDPGTSVDLSQYSYVLDFYDEQPAALVAPLVVGMKPPVDLYATTNQTLSGGTPNQRMLLVGQTDPTTNGLYVTSSGAWSRATDAAKPSDFTGGFLVVAKAPVIFSSILEIPCFQFVTPLGTGLQIDGTGASQLFFDTSSPETIPQRSVNWPYGTLYAGAPGFFAPQGTILTGALSTFAPADVRWG